MYFTVFKLIKYAEHHSIIFNNGLRQECIPSVSPAIYSKFINDFEKCIAEVKVSLGICFLQMTYFKVLLSEDPDGLHNFLGEVSKYCKDNDLNSNIWKTNIGIF